MYLISGQPGSRSQFIPAADTEGGAVMQILATLVIGLIVGAIAKLLMPGKDPGGIIVTILLGIAGAFVGTYVGRALGLYAPGASAGFIMSVAGAMLLLFIYRLFMKRTKAA
jgi:uncharacterized membrane protein YeaQ/YmgE (transglycosylase-associated protein family)